MNIRGTVGVLVIATALAAMGAAPLLLSGPGVNVAASLYAALACYAAALLLVGLAVAWQTTRSYGHRGI
jgi:hypothetical protein